MHCSIFHLRDIRYSWYSWLYFPSSYPIIVHKSYLEMEIRRQNPISFANCATSVVAAQSNVSMHHHKCWRCFAIGKPLTLLFTKRNHATVFPMKAICKPRSGSKVTWKKTATHNCTLASCRANNSSRESKWQSYVDAITSTHQKITGGSSRL